MSDIGIEASERDTLPGELVEVDLARADHEHRRPSQEQCGTSHPDSLQEQVGRGDHVRQEEGVFPAELPESGFVACRIGLT
jgi:hypothetical protein